MTTPHPPEGLDEAGDRLWRSVVDSFELDEHEITLLAQACRTVDTIDALQAAIDADGPLIETRSGPKAHPAVVEIRQQRIVLARLLVALRVPIGDQEQPSKVDPVKRAQRRGTRGAYRLGVVS